jgi:hypothetical protein
MRHRPALWPNQLPEKRAEVNGRQVSQLARRIDTGKRVKLRVCVVLCTGDATFIGLHRFAPTARTAREVDR